MVSAVLARRLADAVGDGDGDEGDVGLARPVSDRL